MAVDDEVSALRVLKQLLEAMGCEVVALSDSCAALEHLKGEKVDGLFVDIVMPDLDGFGLTRQARLSRLNCQIPIIMLSGLDDAETMRKGFDAGANFFLGKPFTRERVYKLLGATRGPMMREKYRYARLSFQTEVDCTAAKSPHRQFRSSSVNISEGGMMLGAVGGLTVGEDVELAFRLPNTANAINARATVMRMEGPGVLGVKFLKLTDRNEADLRAYIAARLEA